MRGSHHILRWLAPALAACAVIILGAASFASGILPGSKSAAHQQTSSSGAACATRFDVSPTSGAVGAPITIRGSAWPSGKTVGIYLVDPTHHVRPVTLQLLTVPQGGAWTANVTVPAALVYHAVGDETTGNGSPQTINQNIAPGSYLIYAAAGDAASFSSSAVCPVKFAILSASGAAGNTASYTNTPGQTAGSAPSAFWSGWHTWFGFALFILFALVLCGALALLRIPRAALVRNGRRLAAAGGSLGLAVCMILVTMPPAAQAGPKTQAAAQTALTTTTLYSDDFEADTLGAVPAGWSIEAGTSWSVQQNGTQALEQTSATNSTLYGIYTGPTTWTDYTVAASVQPGAGSTTNGSSVVAIEGRRQDVNNFYSLLIKNGSEWYLGYKLNGSWVTLANGSMSYTTTTWYTWTLTMTGTTISASINGVTLATVTDRTFSSGDIGLKTRNQSAFDNILVTASGTVSPTPTPTATATPSGTATATATATAAPTATATPFGSGTITGHVSNAANGAALVGATVTTVPASVAATTNGSGNYTLQNIPSNTYDVVVKMSGYNANHAPNVVVSNTSSTTANVALAGVLAYSAMDNFTQPNQSSWNPSTDGNTWTDDATAYPGAVVSINNNLGFADTYTAATDRDEWMGPYYADQLISADFNVGQYGQDAYQHGARLLGRAQDGNNFIDFAVNYATATLQIWVNTNNNWTMMSQVNVPAFKTNQWYHAQLLTVGTWSYGKVWAYGAADPGWQISGSQNSLNTGAGGNRSTYCDINWANYSYQAVTTITGVVTNTSGSAIAGATITDGTRSVTTNSSGRYILIEPNTSATYTVTASATGYSSKSAKATTTNLTSTTLNVTL